MTRVVITARAECDLEDVWLAIASDNPGAATRLLRTIGDKIDLLGDFPWLGTRRSDIRPGLRMMVARPF